MAIHVAITRKILPGKEKEFTEALRRFLGESFIHGGVQGAGMLTTNINKGEIGVLRSFANEEQRAAFYASQQFKDWDAYAATLTEGDAIYRDLHGLEAWFRAPDAPARWKMAIVTFVGVYPTSVILSLLIDVFGSDLSFFTKSVIMGVAMVTLLTWVVMPLAIKIFRPWLHSAKTAAH